MPLRIPYNQLPNLGALESDDIIPGLRPAFEEGSMTVGDLTNFVKPGKVYRVNMSQSGTSDPTVDYVWENEIGSIVWTYNGTGIYWGTLTGAFADYDLPRLARVYFISVDNNPNYYKVQKIDDDTIQIIVQDYTFAFANSRLNQSFIEIFMYAVPL
jgi:hypothetical protein